MKIIEASAGYAVLDRMIAKIQKNGGMATREMLDAAHREWCDIPGIVHMRHIGRDSHSRPVYEDLNGELWKDVDPRADRPARLCNAINNAFDGEPDTPMEYMERFKNTQVRFMPNRDTWGR